MKTEIKLIQYYDKCIYIHVTPLSQTISIDIVSEYEYVDARLTLMEAKTLMYELTKGIVMMESKQVDKRN